MKKIKVNYDDPFWIENDPDLVKADGYTLPFYDFGKYIEIVEDDSDCISLLERWLNGDGVVLQNATWNDFDKLQNAIAYRGGSGYVYTIIAF